MQGALGDFRVNIAPILNLSPPRFPIALPPALQDAYVKSIRLGNVDVLKDGLHLEKPNDATLDVVLATNPGAIEGAVTDERQQALTDISVVLLPDVRRRYELYRTALTDPSGRFRFDRVPPGDYKIFAWKEVENDAWFDPEFMRGYESRGKAVRVSDGSAASAPVTVIP